MSKLKDKFDRASQGSTTPMGFAGQRSQEKVAPILVIGVAEIADKDAIQKISATGLDAALLIANSPPKSTEVKAANVALKSIPWGIWEGGTYGTAHPADFHVIGSSEMLLALLSADDATNLMVLDSQLDDLRLRVIEDLPVDVFLFPISNENGLTLDHLIEAIRVRRATTKYLVVYLSSLPGKEELLHLYEAGVNAIAIQVADLRDSALKAIMDNAGNIPTKKAKNRSRAGATLPSLTIEDPPARQQEPDPDDDDYE